VREVHPEVSFAILAGLPPHDQEESVGGSLPNVER